MLIIQKYGGTSLADAEKIRSAACRAVALCRQGHRVVMVVSAQGHTTDALLEQAAAVNRRGSAREMDALLSTGEQISAALMAMAIGALGHPAISLTGWQAGIRTDDIHTNARITDVDTARIRKELDAGKIVVVTGFQGIDQDNSITTLGRGGSDTTAVALAAYLKSDKCQIFTDVDGIYDRDPRMYSDAVRFHRIGYDRMLTLIENGAQVLHDRSVELAKAYGISVEVLSAFTSAPGTILADSESL
jgi:aspartate kinase